MPAYYVASTGNNSDGLTWAKAFTTFAGAATAATADGDIIYVDQGFTDTLTANTTYAFNNHIRIICSNDKVNEPPQTLGTMGTDNWIGHSSASYTIQINCAKTAYIYGLTLRTASTGTVLIYLNQYSNTGHLEMENCYLWQGTSGARNIVLGSGANTFNNYTKLKDCTLRFGATGQYVEAANYVEFENVTVSSSGSRPTVLFGGVPGLTYPGGYFRIANSDLSYITGTLVGDFYGSTLVSVFENCKLASEVTVLASQSNANKSSANVWVYNCSSGDTHYHMRHHDAFGSMVIDTGIYANDGAQYDGTNYCSWKIVTTANCSYYTPYVSPWIDCYHSGTSAITPSLEIVRSGSATAYQDDEVWGEFSYQGTSGFPLATVVSDRKALLAAAADQTTGTLNASGWTGENATSWFGKLNPTATITPAEIGHLRARVVVGEPEVTVYVDPTIRGRS